LERAVAELVAESRLILAAHYLDARTLAEIGCMLGIHESTVSRRLNKAVRFLRKRTIHHLRRSGIGMQQATELMAVDVRQISMNLRDCLQPVKDGL
jgi:RNA polymerase sigma-70 factor (ECF subfamily)